MKDIKEKANVLIEALPYIQKYKDKIVVIKYGGKAMVNEELKNSVITDIVLLNNVGIKAVVVHGGGPEVNKEMEKAKIEPKFVDGLRVTDKETLNIVKKVFLKINKEVVKKISDAGGKAVTLNHESIFAYQKNSSLGYVGEVSSIDKKKIISLLKKDYIPVISSLGTDDKGQAYNINADSVATAVAINLNAEKLTILTDVDGVMENGIFLPHLSISEIKNKINRGVINGGMIPKVIACMDAVKNGCKKAHLINGTIKNALLLEIFTDKGIGTEIVK